MIMRFLLWVPVAVLLWRALVSKQRASVRAGAAVAAVLAFVGSVVAPQPVPGAAAGMIRITNAREAFALALAALGPAYLIAWSWGHRGRGRYRTGSILAAVIGLVPILGALAVTAFYAE